MIRAALLIAASTIASASPLSAQLYSAAEGDVLSRLIDTACIDLTDDIGCEQVTLLASADGELAADLFIYPNVQNDADAPILFARNAVWSGAMIGDSPYLERSETGALRIVTEQISSGRNPWTDVFTIVERGGKLVVAGRTFSTYDRIDNSTFRCDVNLLTGDWEASGTPPATDGYGEEFEMAGRVAPSAPDLSRLDYQDGQPEICTDIRARWAFD